MSDSVKGTRPDGTYGSITITGFPVPDYYRRKKLLGDRKKKLDEFELQLLELTNEVDDYINSLADSRMRRMIRYKFFRRAVLGSGGTSYGRKVYGGRLQNGNNEFFER